MKEARRRPALHQSGNGKRPPFVDRWIAGLLLTAAAVIALPAAAPAKQLAFVVGNEAYQEISPLSAGANDARAMSAALKRAGFEIEQVENGTQRQISRALAAVEGLIAPGDTVLFHYSGHGFEIDGQNWLLPVDVPAAREGEAGLVKGDRAVPSSACPCGSPRAITPETGRVCVHHLTDRAISPRPGASAGRRPQHSAWPAGADKWFTARLNSSKGVAAISNEDSTQP